MKDAALVLLSYLYVKYGLRFRSRAALERYQQKRLLRFQKQVLARSPYYTAYKDKPFSDYPLMDKAGMMRNFDMVNTAGLKLDEAMQIALRAERERDFKETLNGFAVGLSSGTSGTRGLFAVSKKERLQWTGAILAKILPTSLFHKHTIAFFLRADNRLYQSVHKRGGITLHFFDLAKPFSEHLRALSKLRPTQIIAPARVLYLLAEAQREGSITVEPQRINSVAEVLEPSDEQMIKAVFGKPVHQIYQCTEGFLACTCPYGRFHLNEEMVYFEKEWIDEGTRRFIPIITDFSRTTQPFVRYRLNDVLVVDDQLCPCGSSTQVISRIEGREDDVLYGQKKDGTLVPLFSDHLRHVIVGATDKLEDYMLTQEERLSLAVEVPDTFPENEWRKLVEAICKVFSTHACLVPSIDRRRLSTLSLAVKRRRIIRRFPVVKDA